MKKAEIQKHFRNESEKMKKYRLASIHAQLEFEKAEDNNDSALPKYEMLMNNAEKEEDSFSDFYAKAIFDFLQEQNPVLIRKRNRQKVSWIDAFGSDYSKLSSEIKGSIIALIEEDGGQYRLAA